jgi:tRNA threonylcarbamoyl adenosine modification protein YjeE
MVNGTDRNPVEGAPDQMTFTRFLKDEDATAEFGEALAQFLTAGDILAISGPLGAGKTALARAIIGKLSADAEVTSPTYGLVTTYEAPGFLIWHFDLYRLEDRNDIWELGFEEAMENGVVLIEWPEIVKNLLPSNTLAITMRPEAGGRRIGLEGGGEWTEKLNRLAKAR